MSEDAANFSFYGKLPTYKPTRHCCGLFRNSILFWSFSFLTALQLTALIIINLIEELNHLNPYGKKHGFEAHFLIVLSSIWLVIIMFSFIGFVKKIEYLHFPLMLIEAFFCIVSCALTGVFIDSLLHSNNQDLIIRIAFNAIHAIYHGYYTYIIFCLWRDIRKKRKTDEFIARQHMIDDVCEEMIWEEEEAQRYAEVRQFSMSGIYEEDSLSFCSEPSSICSTELTINTMYNAYLQNRRVVTFYEDDENYCYY